MESISYIITSKAMLPKSAYKKALIVTRTPMRITLAGGGTDVTWYSKFRGGAWISVAINKYVYVALNKSTPFGHPEFISESKRILKQVRNDDTIIRECLKLAKIKDKINIEIFSDVAPQSGLGGSGSLEVGLLHALHIFKGEKFTKLQLAQEAADIEISHLSKPVGPQDQYIAALGGIRSFKMNKKGKVTSQSLHFSKETLNKLRKNLIFFATGIKKDTQEILTKEKNKSQNLKVLDKIKDLGREAKNYLTAGKLDEFGETLHRHWLIKKELSDQVSSSSIDEWYNEGIKSGALGGKIMGAGGGGWFVFYVNKNHANFVRKMKRLGLTYQLINFDWEGTKHLQ